MSPIRILHVRNTDKLCGPGRIILGNVKNNKKGEVCHYVASFLEARQKNNAFLEQMKAYCRVLEISTPSRFTLRPIWCLKSFALRNHIDIIHCHDYKSNFFGLLAAKIARIPVVTTVHGWITNNLKERIYVAVDCLMLRHFDAVISVSRKLYEEIRAKGVDSGTLALIPNGVVVEDFSVEQSYPTLRDELGLAPGLFLIGNIGRLSSEKGQALFIEAASQIVNRDPSVRFVIVGEGPDRNSLYDYVKRLNLGGKVFFTGHRTDMRDVYRSLDLMVLCSRTEGLPMVVLEAMASKIPVVATDVGGVSELVKHQETGLLVLPGSSPALIQAIEYALDNREAIRKIALRAFEMVCNEFNFQKNVDRTIALYKKLIQNRQGAIGENEGKS